MIFGISNCDTVRKARKALESAGVSYAFHDFRKEGLTEAAAGAMINALGADAVLNKRGTTWRGLSASEQAAAEGDGLAAVLVAHPALIKRPVWLKDGDYKLGYKAADAEALLAWAGA